MSVSVSEFAVLARSKFLPLRAKSVAPSLSLVMSVPILRVGGLPQTAFRGVCHARPCAASSCPGARRPGRCRAGDAGRVPRAGGGGGSVVGMLDGLRGDNEPAGEGGCGGFGSDGCA